MKMNFEYFQIQKRILQTASTEKVDEKNGVIYPVFMFPSWDVVRKLSKKLIFFFNFMLTSARNLSRRNLHTSILKVLLCTFRKWYCLLCYDLLFLRYLGLKSKNFVKCWVSIFLYFNCQDFMKGGTELYKLYHFLKECNENFQIYICKLL